MHMHEVIQLYTYIHTYMRIYIHVYFVIYMHFSQTKYGIFVIRNPGDFSYFSFSFSLVLFFTHLQFSVNFHLASIATSLSNNLVK